MRKLRFGEQRELFTADQHRKVAALHAMGLRQRDQSRRVDIPGSVSAMAEPEDLYAFVTKDMSSERVARFLNGS